VTHNVSSTGEVDEILAKAKGAGGTVIKPAQRTSYGGYAGYFQDTEGHIWEVVYNPNFEAL
jgi:predicted lactoylglutathione lyase